jgi:uncharacterized protein YbbC (DUF1343 family)
MATVLCGIDRPETYASLLEGKRIGLVTNPTGISRDGRSTINLLHERFHLTALFSPEHGVRGNLQAGEEVDTYLDEATGLPVYSLFGDLTNTRIPPEVLKDLDLLAFDIQDVGARFYSYLYTLSDLMQDCARAGIPILVFDRPNPIGADRIDGTILDEAFASQVGRFPIATRYGMTMGEYARFINTEMQIGCELTVAGLGGYHRGMHYEETGLIWINPSPNLPTVDSCIAYIGTCLFEGTNISQGRGTTRPFELIGAPWLDVPALLREAESWDLPGIFLRETYFTPTFSLYQGELCHGFQLHLTDRAAAQPFEASIRLIDAIRKLQPDQLVFQSDLQVDERPWIDLLLGTDALRQPDFRPEEFFEAQAEKRAEYRRRIAPYLLYPEK